MKKIIQYLIAANLLLILIYLLSRLSIIQKFITVFTWVILTPTIFGIFIFYILKPLNKTLLNKKIPHSKAALLTLSIFIFILVGLLKGFGDYVLSQVYQIKELIQGIIEKQDISYITDFYNNNEEVKTIIRGFSSGVLNYIQNMILNSKEIFNKGMILLSNFLLIILVVFFLLKDGHIFKEKMLKYSPGKYKKMITEILEEGDKVLATYIIGQAKVALSLAIMIYIGYKIIGMPTPILFASITFILAFIPFVGFLISMIVPYIIAITMGYTMIIKLTILFIIAQSLKGRVVVPFIMGKTMNIHPITDIFLVVGGAAIGGPLVAFSIVPIYSLIKLVLGKLYENGYLKVVDKIKKV